MSTLTWKSINTVELRKYKDPNIINLDHYIAVVRAKDMPTDISHNPNPRANAALFAKKIYEDIEESLLDKNDLTFHLKNKGIVLTASQARFEKGQAGDILHLGFSEEDGILDGSHTYKLIDRNIKRIPETQCVCLEVRVGKLGDYLSDMAEGLNTTVQVQSQSLADYRGEFDFIKKAIKDKPYHDQVAWVEYEEKDIPVLLLVRLMTAFNIGKYPSSEEHPIVSYSGKTRCLDVYLAEYERGFKKSERTYEKLKNILPDILELHDYIQLESKRIYNRGSNKWERATTIIEKRTHGEFAFYFLDKKSTTRLREGALFPLLSSFRCLIEEDADTKAYKWKIPFEKVKAVYDDIGGQLLDMTLKSCADFNGNVQTLGKKGGHWNNLYMTVENYVLKNIVDR